jgi:hypothetical protein
VEVCHCFSRHAVCHQRLPLRCSPGYRPSNLRLHDGN